MSKVQSVVFDISKSYQILKNGPKTRWTQYLATKWLDAHGYKHPKVDMTQTQIRFRQLPPQQFKRFATRKLDRGVMLILGFND